MHCADSDVRSLRSTAFLTGGFMPAYEYKCDTGHEFEVHQNIKDEPLTVCPTCGKRAVRLISRTSFVLKGGGWSPTNYGK